MPIEEVPELHLVVGGQLVTETSTTMKLGIVVLLLDCKRGFSPLEAEDGEEEDGGNILTRSSVVA